MTAYTHPKRVSSKLGYWIGEKGSETQLIGSTGAITITGSATTGVQLATGTFTTGIDIGGTVSKAIKIGAYGAFLTHQATELVTVAASGASSGWYLGYGCYIRATGEDAKPFGFCATLESTNTTGIDRMQSAQFISLLGTAGGSEAAVLKTRNGDATAGLFGSWHKIGGNVNCVANSGSRMAAVWLDNQFHGTMNGDEYTIFSTTGGSRPDGWACFNTSSSGWNNLFVFDSTMTGSAPIGAAVDTDGNNSDISLIMEYNSTTYYIPAFVAAKLA